MDVSGFFRYICEWSELGKKYAVAINEAAPKIKQWELDDAAWLQANPTPELRAQNSKARPRKPSMPPTIAGLYNGMLHALEPYGIKGVIWFQADDNLGSTKFYGDLIKTLITSWRTDWQEEMPFYYVEMTMENGADLPMRPFRTDTASPQ